MKGFYLAAAAVLATVVQADLPEGAVQWSISKRQPYPRANRRRDTANTDQATISNKISSGGYFAECKIGTPAQTLTLQLDTGSSDTWLPSSDASVCQQTRASNGCTLGSFNSSASSTFTVADENAFSITYVDGSTSKGDYIADVFTIGNSTINNLTMGLGQTTNIANGLIGVGYTSNEAIVASENSLNARYANLPVAMVDAGIIKTNAYSLWLNDLDASSGSILFGAIDTEKYEGTLTSIDIYQSSSANVFTSFLVALTSVNASSSSGTDELSSREFPIGVVLDSGTTLTYVPNDLAEQIWTETGAVYSSSLGLAIIPCSSAESSGKLDFGFAGPGGPVISIGMDELVLDLGGSAVFTSGQYKGQQACEFGIQNSSSDPFLLGDTFLRSAYVVYDLVNNKIGLAPTKFNATASNVVAFASSGATIPSSTVAPHQDEVTNSSSFSTPDYSASLGFSTDSSGPSLAVPWEALSILVVSAVLFVSGGLYIL